MLFSEFIEGFFRVCFFYVFVYILLCKYISYIIKTKKFFVFSLSHAKVSKLDICSLSYILYWGDCDKNLGLFWNLELWSFLQSFSGGMRFSNFEKLQEFYNYFKLVSLL